MPTRETKSPVVFTDARTIQQVETSIERISLSVIGIDGALDMPIPDCQEVLKRARSIQRDARIIERLLENAAQN